MKKLYIVFCITLIIILVGCGDPVNNGKSKQSQAALPNVSPSVPADNTAHYISPEMMEFPSLELTALKYPDKEVLVFQIPASKFTAEDMECLNEKLIELNKEYVIYIDQTIEEYELGDFTEAVNKRLSEGTQIDLISSSAFNLYGGTIDAYSNNWFIELDEFLNTDGSQIKEAIGDDLFEVCRVNGHIYGLSTAIPDYDTYAYYVNLDLLEKYNLTEEDIRGVGPEDLADVFEIIAAEKDCAVYRLDRAKDDPSNGYYKADAFRYFGAQRSQIVSMTADGTNQIINLFENDDFVRWLKAINKYIKLGYSEGDNTFFISDGYYSDIYPWVKDYYLEMLKTEYPKVENIAIVPYERMTLHSSSRALTGICSSTKNEAYAKDFLIEMYTNPEISNILVYGSPNKYIISDERVLFLTDEEGEYRNSSESGRIRVWGNCLITKLDSEETQNKSTQILVTLSEMRRTGQEGLYIDMSDYSETAQKVCQIWNSYKGIFYGEYADVDEVIKEINMELRNAGIDQMIEALSFRTEQYPN